MAEKLVKQMEKKRGYILRGHRVLAEYDSNKLESYDNFFSSVMVRKSALNRKTKELIALSVLASRGLFDPFLLHAERAFKEGASINEIIDAVCISGLYAGAPSMLYALQYLDKKFGKVAKKGNKLWLNYKY
ncbi:MAG: carboxymuconolactone decarboxylase family protein [Conexivisphaerales archaeon]